MKYRIICVLLLFVFYVSASNLHADDIILKDTGEVALNNTNPTDGDNVTTGGWTLEKGAALGPYYGIYSSGAAYEGSLGIQLMGHGANIMSPSFSISLGTASINTRIVAATGGVPNALAVSILTLYSNSNYVAIRLKAAAADWNFYWNYNNGGGSTEGIIPGVSCNNLDWWTYTIKVTPDNTAIFTVFDGTNTSSVEVAHGITDDFTSYGVRVDRFSGGFDVATADYDNLLFTAAGQANTPTAVSPSDETNLGSVSGVTLTSSTFSDSDPSDTHVRSLWLVRRADSVYSRSDYDSTFDVVTSSGLTKHSVSGLVSGMKYKWKVGYVDSGSGTTSWSSEYHFKVGTSQADSSVMIPPGTQVADFKMISIIQWPDDPGIISILGDEMGGSYDRKYFRIGAYDPTNGSGGYLEYGSGNEMYPGESAWILARNGLDITVNGVPVSTSLDIETPLLYNTGNANGWNQIGSPNNADYYWGNVEMVQYDIDGSILNGPTPISSLSDPNSFIDKKLWRWSNGAYFSDTTWIRKYEGYWVKVKASNVFLRFPVGAQAKLSNPGTMLAGLISEGKKLIKKNSFLALSPAIADDEDSPPGPMGDFSSTGNNAGGGSSGGGSGGFYPNSGRGGGGTNGGGAGCFISTLLD